MSDDTSCEVCGMVWNAKPREMCPRCALEDAKARASALQRDLDDARSGWEAAVGRGDELEALVSTLTRDGARLIDERDQVKARAAEMERERDEARNRLTHREASRCNAIDRDSALAQVEVERARVGELEGALKTLSDAAPDPAFVRQAALEDESDPACMIEEGARCYREALAAARSLLSQPAPSPGTDHEDRHG